MKQTVIKCDYCKTEIKEGDPNTMIDGKGQFDITLPDSKIAVLQFNLISGVGKNLERDACSQCIGKNLMRAYKK